MHCSLYSRIAQSTLLYIILTPLVQMYYYEFTITDEEAATMTKSNLVKVTQLANGGT